MLIHLISSNAMTGQARYALEVCRYTAEQGEPVLAITRGAKAVDDPLAKAGVPVAHAPLRDYPDIFSALILKRTLRSLPENDVPVVIHVHRYRDALTAIAARHLSKRPGIKVVITRHIADPAKDNWLRRFIYRRLDAHIFVSEYAKREFLSTWQHGRYPFDTARLHVLPNSRLYMPAPTPLPEKGPLTAMYHGMLRPGKGLETIIQALHQIIHHELRPIRLRLRIAGSGNPDYIDSLRNLALSLGVMDAIDWAINTPDPSEMIQNCHFGVLPTEAPEAFGMTNLEYMAAGRAQITTFRGPRPEYLTPGGEALEVPPADPEALAEAMHRLATDRKLAAEMGRKAVKRFRSQLSWPYFISRLFKIYSLKSFSE